MGNMDLNKKIDEIRSKPEHIRLRYVWGAVGICMTFVLVLWVFSVRETIKTMSNQVKSSGSCMTDFKKKFDEQGKEEAPSIGEILDQTGQKLEAGMSNN
ncbi:hypothetical protein J7J13_01280 [bacterium]|nr:hypothetical protein [bacterium]